MAKTTASFDILKAAEFAAIKHKKQKRKDPDGTPYINHPIGVAAILTQGGVDDTEVLQAALLHDTVEDTDTSLEEVGREFGERVRRIVDEVSDNKNLSKEERKRLQIVHTPHISTEAKLVKMADKLYNLRDLQRATPKGWSSQRKHEYFIWSAKVLKGCRGVNEYMEKHLDKVLLDNNVDPSTVILREDEKTE